MHSYDYRGQDQWIGIIPGKLMNFLYLQVHECYIIKISQPFFKITVVFSATESA
jgi:hypothetical protein